MVGPVVIKGAQLSAISQSFKLSSQLLHGSCSSNTCASFIWLTESIVMGVSFSYSDKLDMRCMAHGIPTSLRQ